LFAGDDVRTVSARRAINSKGTHRGAVDEVLVLLGQSPERLLQAP
jgi:hypothetical protein